MKQAIDFLSPALRQYIGRQGWSSFTDIQSAAIENITTTPDNFVLVARTASGKTEAAFLPAIDLVDDWAGGVKILYISPLIALINDQFERIDSLCQENEIKITKWHSEASLAAKRRLMKSPEGILFITPESIESLLINRPEYLSAVFGDLRFIVLDEIHSFLGVDRGRHLRSLIYRLRRFAQTPARFVGLSATINPQSYGLVKDFYVDDRSTKIIRDKKTNQVERAVRYFAGSEEGSSLPPELLDELYSQTQACRALIFPNSRGRVEEVAVGLKRRATRSGSGHGNYYAHHSSVDRQLRAEVEQFAKQSYQQNFAISCTSTLELGIDIGAVDTVVQVDATHSVASLTQRLGRSGRRGDKASRLIIYATNGWDLLRSVACIELSRVGFVEPAEGDSYAANVFLHQVLSTVKQYRGLGRNELLSQLGDGHPLGAGLGADDREAIIDHLIGEDILEIVGNDLIIGLGGEKITESRDFYSLFETRSDFKVFYGSRQIGELQWSLSLQVDSRVFLAAKIWRILSIDQKSYKITVEPAPDGKKPSFASGPGVIHQSVYDKMLQILSVDDRYDYLDPPASERLDSLRQDFVDLKGNSNPWFRPILADGSSSVLYAFAGTKILETIQLILKHEFGLESASISGSGSLRFSLSVQEVRGKLRAAFGSGFEAANVQEIVLGIIADGGQLVENKFASFLPPEIRARQFIASRLDVSGAKDFATNVVLG